MAKINPDDNTDTDSIESEDENCEDISTCHVVNKVQRTVKYSMKNYENFSKRSALMDVSYTDTEKKIIKNKTKQKENVIKSHEELPEDVRQLLEIRHFSTNRMKNDTSSEDLFFYGNYHSKDYSNITKGKQISNTTKISENKNKRVIISENIKQDTETPIHFLTFDNKGMENVTSINKNSSLFVENKSPSSLISDKNYDISITQEKINNKLVPLSKQKHEKKKGTEKIPIKKHKLDLNSDKNGKCSVSKIKAKQIEQIKQNSFMYRDIDKNSEELFQYTDQIRKKLFKSLPTQEGVVIVENYLLHTTTKTEENNIGKENSDTNVSISKIDSKINQSWPNENILTENPLHEKNSIQFKCITDCMQQISSFKKVTTSEKLTLPTSDMTSSKLLWCNRITCAPKQQSYKSSPISSSEALGLPHPRFRVPPFDTETPKPDTTQRTPSAESIPPSKTPLPPAPEESKETTPKHLAPMKAPDLPSQIQDLPPKPMRTSSSKAVTFPKSPTALTTPIPELVPSHSPKKSKSSSPKMPASPSSEAPSSQIPTIVTPTTSAPDPPRRKSRKRSKSPSEIVSPADPPSVPPTAPITPAPEHTKRESRKKTKPPSSSEPPAAASPNAAKIPISSADEPTHRKPRKKSKSPSPIVPQTVPSPEPQPPTAPETKSSKSKEKPKSLTESVKDDNILKGITTKTEKNHDKIKATHKGKASYETTTTPPPPRMSDTPPEEGDSKKQDDKRVSSQKHSKQSKPYKKEVGNSEKNNDDTEEKKQNRSSKTTPPKPVDNSEKTNDDTEKKRQKKSSKENLKPVDNSEKNNDDTEEKTQNISSKTISKPSKTGSSSMKDKLNKILPLIRNSIVKKKEKDKPPKLRVQFTDPKSNKKEFIDPEFLALYNPDIVRKAYKNQIDKLRDEGQYTDSEFDEMDDEIYEIILSYASRKKKVASDLSDISLDLSKRSSGIEGFNFKDIINAFRKQKLDRATSESLHTLKQNKPHSVSLQPLSDLFTETQKDLNLPTNMEVTSQDVERTLMRDFSPERRAICDDRCFRIFTKPEPGIQITIPNTFYSVQEFILASGFDPEGPLITDQIIHAKFLICIEVANMYHETLSLHRAGLLIHLAMTAPNSVQGFLRKLAEAVVNRRINSEAQINAFLNKIHQMAIGSETAVIKESSRVEQDNFRLIQRLRKKIFSEFYRKVGFWDLKNGEQEVTAKHLTLIYIIPKFYKTGLYPFIDFVAEFIAFNKIMTTDQLEVALNRFLACSDGHITREEFSDWCYFGEKRKKKVMEN